MREQHEVWLSGPTWALAPLLLALVALIAIGAWTVIGWIA
jgi:hypothetical protein